MADDKNRTAATVAFTRFLAQHNMRKTMERYAILDKAYDITGHFTVDSLHEALCDDGYHVSPATIYNTLELLVEASLVRRRNFGGSTARYEKITRGGNHHHLVCTRCGKVKELKDASVDSFLELVDCGSFKPTYADLYIYGTCPKCQRKSRSKTGSDCKEEKQ